MQRGNSFEGSNPSLSEKFTLFHGGLFFASKVSGSKRKYFSLTQKITHKIKPYHKRANLSIIFKIILIFSLTKTNKTKANENARASRSRFKMIFILQPQPLHLCKQRGGKQKEVFFFDAENNS